MREHRPEFLACLSPADRDALEALGTVRAATKGETLLAQGQAPDRVLVLRSGRVRVVASGEDGTQSVLMFRGPGSLLGEQALFDGSPRSATVMAIEPVELLVVPASRFRAFLEARPSAAMALVSMLSARLRDSDRRLVELAAADTTGRVCARLIELCEEHGETDEDGSIHITLPLTQEDLAGWTGSSLEATAKALRQLRELGWISTGRRALTVHDVDALRGRAALSG